MDRASGIPFADILFSPIHLEPVPRDTTFKSNVDTNILNVTTITYLFLLIEGQQPWVSILHVLVYLSLLTFYTV